jgi:hypothetical protein
VEKTPDGDGAIRLRNLLRFPGVASPRHVPPNGPGQSALDQSAPQQFQRAEFRQGLGHGILLTSRCQLTLRRRQTGGLTETHRRPCQPKEGK